MCTAPSLQSCNQCRCQRTTARLSTPSCGLRDTALCRFFNRGTAVVGKQLIGLRAGFALHERSQLTRTIKRGRAPEVHRHSRTGAVRGCKCGWHQARPYVSSASAIAPRASCFRGHRRRRAINVPLSRSSAAVSGLRIGPLQRHTLLLLEPVEGLQAAEVRLPRRRALQAHCAIRRYSRACTSAQTL